MLPLLPILLVGGGAWTVVKLSKKISALPASKALEIRYQKFVQEKIDPWFGTKQRTQQLQEFSGDSNKQEADINRRLGLTVANTGLAILGAVFYPPLSWLSAVGLVYIIWPLAQHNLRLLLEEQRVKYRLVAMLSVWASLLAGYYVVSSLMAIVLFIAFKLAARTQAYSQATLMETMALQLPTSIWIQVNNLEREISFAELQVGDIVVLSAGQTVPVDGQIVEGMAFVDQHILTGEAQPVEKIVGDAVFANTLVLQGKLYVRVEHTGNDTAAAQIIKILGNMASHRLEHEARSEQLADQLTMPVLACSGLALVTVGGGGAAAILNSGFGSTMFISGPLSMLSHLNLASHHGILVKDGRALEKLQKVDTVVFDKTGTLTLEQLEVSNIYCCVGWQEQQVLAYAALAEYRQTHPIAKAILVAADQAGLARAIPDMMAYEMGLGVQVGHQGQTIQVGSPRFIQQSQINIPTEIALVPAHCQTAGSSLVMVAVEGQLIGALELQARLRPETVELVNQLHRRGLKLYILSGDHYQPTQHLAQRLNIDDFFAEVLPAGKADKIRQLQQEGRTVCFVGDGINDAIALQQADVSVSLQGATAIATDCAQIVLMKQSLLQLGQLFEIADDFNQNLDQTMRLAYIPGSILISGVFLFHFGMVAALLLYGTGVTATIFNALSPLRKLSHDSGESG